MTTGRGPTAPAGRAWAFIELNLRGAGQVMFMNNPVTGAGIIAAVIYGAVDAGMPQVGIGAVVGLLAGTLTAMALHVDKDTLGQGLFGFSPLLTGAAVPTFLGNDVVMWVYLVIGAAATTVVTLAVGKVFATWGVPALTFPFVLATWFLMLAAYQFHRVKITALNAPMLPVHAAAAHLDWSAATVVTAMLKGVSQVFLIGNWVSGVIILAALAVNSRWAASLAAAGTVIATLLAAGLGADTAGVTAGLYGFSAVLTAVAVGCVFYQPAWPVLLYALLATVFTVIAQAALNTLLAPAGVPTFTAPFVFATWLFLLPKRDVTLVRHHERIADGILSRTTPRPDGADASRARQQEITDARSRI